MHIGRRVLLCLQLAALLLCMAMAASVTGEPVEACAGEEIQIPVCITRNMGIMGFRIEVEYPEELLRSPEVQRGSLTETGLLESGLSQEGRIHVLWCGTSDVQGDGSLFVLRFQVPEGVRDTQGEVRLSYVQEDTFNELWEDVVLELSPIRVILRGSTSSGDSGQTSGSVTVEDRSPSASQTATQATSADPEREEAGLPPADTQSSEPTASSEQTAAPPQWEEGDTSPIPEQGAPSSETEGGTERAPDLPEPVPVQTKKTPWIGISLCLIAAVSLGGLGAMMLKRRK